MQIIVKWKARLDLCMHIVMLQLSLTAGYFEAIVAAKLQIKLCLNLRFEGFI